MSEEAGPISSRPKTSSNLASTHHTAHLEEDAGDMHDETGKGDSRIDLNRLERRCWKSQLSRYA